MQQSYNRLEMSKIALFVTLVLVGILAVLMISSQSGQKKSDTGLNLSGLSPIPSQNTSPTPVVLAASTTPSGSTTPTATPTPAQAVTATSATIKTSKGDIALTFYGKDAPNTVANFVKKASSGFYNGLTFHRVEDWVVQGGDPKGNGTGGGNMPTELNSKPFVIGSVGVARASDIKVSNDSQFFITKKDSSFLNNQYTNFGIVTKGMDVVNQIQIGDKILGIRVE